MCDMTNCMMKDMEMYKRDIRDLREKLDAVAKYLKMDFKYNPESYEMMKPEELAKEGQTPIMVR